MAEVGSAGCGHDQVDRLLGGDLVLILVGLFARWRSDDDYAIAQDYAIARRRACHRASIHPVPCGKQIRGCGAGQSQAWDDTDMRALRRPGTSRSAVRAYRMRRLAVGPQMVLAEMVARVVPDRVGVVGSVRSYSISSVARAAGSSVAGRGWFRRPRRSGRRSMPAARRAAA